MGGTAAAASGKGRTEREKSDSEENRRRIGGDNKKIAETKLNNNRLIVFKWLFIFCIYAFGRWLFGWIGYCSVGSARNEGKNATEERDISTVQTGEV